MRLWGSALQGAIFHWATQESRAEARSHVKGNPMPPTMNEPTKGSHRLRQFRSPGPTGCYFITSASFERKRILDNEKAFRILSDSLTWMEQNRRWQWFAFICMPDHVHLVIQLDDKVTLARAMNSFKGFTGKMIKAELALDHLVWQNQYFDRLIRHEREFWARIWYCYENPVRKGLTDEAERYPFWRCRYDLNAHPRPDSTDLLASGR